jgi:hypothetical protein
MLNDKTVNDKTIEELSLNDIKELNTTDDLNDVEMKPLVRNIFIAIFVVIFILFSSFLFLCSANGVTEEEQDDVNDVTTSITAITYDDINLETIINDNVIIPYKMSIGNIDDLAEAVNSNTQSISTTSDAISSLSSTTDNTINITDLSTETMSVTDITKLKTLTFDGVGILNLPSFTQKNDNLSLPNLPLINSITLSTPRFPVWTSASLQTQVNDGWISVTKGGTYEMTHNLNHPIDAPPRIIIYFSTGNNASGTDFGNNMLLDITSYHYKYASGDEGTGYSIKYIDGNSFNIYTGKDNVAGTFIESSSEIVYTRYSNGYYKVFLY